MVYIFLSLATSLKVYLYLSFEICKIKHSYNFTFYNYFQTRMQNCSRLKITSVFLFTKARHLVSNFSASEHLPWTWMLEDKVQNPKIFVFPTVWELKTHVGIVKKIQFWERITHVRQNTRVASSVSDQNWRIMCHSVSNKRDNKGAK